MKSSKLSSGNTLVSRSPAGTGFRAGKMDEKTTFVVICVAAICVAVVALIVPRCAGRRGGAGMRLECPSCNSKVTPENPMDTFPKCSKCGVYAIRVLERECRGCGKKAPYSKTRLTEAGEQQYEQMKASGEQQVAPMMGMGPGMMYDQEVQYWIEQDGNYGWSDWMNTRDPRAMEMQKQYTCPNCGKTQAEIFAEKRSRKK